MIFRSLLAVFLLTTVYLQGHLHATSRSYADLEVVSKNQHFKLTATSPANKDTKRYRTFQVNFTYTLIDQSSGATL